MDVKNGSFLASIVLKARGIEAEEQSQFEARDRGVNSLRQPFPVKPETRAKWRELRPAPNVFGDVAQQLILL